LKREVARENVPGNRFQRSEHGVPIFLHPFRREDQIKAQHSDGDKRVVGLQAKRGSPRRKSSSGGERHVHRLREVDTAVGGTTISVQDGDKDSSVRKDNTNVEVIRIGTDDEHPPREAKTTEASAKGDQQRFESQVEQERGKGITLTDPTSHSNRSNRRTIIQEESRSRGIGGSEGMLYKGRETKFGENGRKIRVRNPVVGLFLIEEQQTAIHRVFGGVTQDVAKSHGDVGSVAITDKTSLMGRDQRRKYSGQARRKHSRENLDVTIGEGDRTPVGKAS
jgi:hypothetical protein